MPTAEQVLAAHEHKIGAIGEAFKKMAEQQAKDAQQKQMDATIDMLVRVGAGVFDKATAYVNVIILAGYAGIFGVWSNVKDGLPLKLNLTIALAVGFSLLIFVLWEIVKMVHHAKTQSKWAKIISVKQDPRAFFDSVQVQQIASDRSRIIFERVWIGVLLLTIFPSLFAALLLFYSVIAKLAGLPLWPS